MYLVRLKMDSLQFQYKSLLKGFNSIFKSHFVAHIIMFYIIATRHLHRYSKLHYILKLLGLSQTSDVPMS